MRIAGWCLGSILLFAACGSPAKPAPAAPAAVAAPADEIMCGQLGHGALYVFRANDPAIDAAQAAYDAATAAGDDHARAAQHYLACAAAYRAIPADFAELDHALANARHCYDAAIIAYYNGRLIEREGRAAVTAALAEEPRAALATDVASALAAQKDCGAE